MSHQTTTSIDNALGHASTVSRHLFDRFFPAPVPRGKLFRTVLADPRIGEVAITGRLHCLGSSALLVLVHGLGGSADSGYVRRMCGAACRRGFDVLRLNLRGADRGGADIYHAGLTEDLEAAINCEMVAGYVARAVVGYSLGGNTTLRFAATSTSDASVDAAVAVCSPLNLAAGAAFIDSPRRRVYRGHLLRGLREIYLRSAPRIADVVGIKPADVHTIRTIADWDNRIVASRFGFGSAANYYRDASALAVASKLACPTLVVRAQNDPMVSSEAAAIEQIASDIESPIGNSSKESEIWRLRRGGHLGFVGNYRIEERILDWLVSLESLKRALSRA